MSKYTQYQTVLAPTIPSYGSLTTAQKILANGFRYTLLNLCKITRISTAATTLFMMCDTSIKTNFLSKQN